MSSKQQQQQQQQRRRRMAVSERALTRSSTHTHIRALTAAYSIVAALWKLFVPKSRDDRTDKRNTRSQQGRVTHKQTHECTLRGIMWRNIVKLMEKSVCVPADVCLCAHGRQSAIRAFQFCQPHKALQPTKAHRSMENWQPASSGSGLQKLTRISCPKLPANVGGLFGSFARGLSKIVGRQFWATLTHKLLRPRKCQIQLLCFAGPPPPPPPSAFVRSSMDALLQQIALICMATDLGEVRSPYFSLCALLRFAELSVSAALSLCMLLTRQRQQQQPHLRVWAA